MDKVIIRNITAEDNDDLAKIIRGALTEFKANKPGTVFYDDTTDHLFESFKTERSTYYVILLNDVIMGGAGIYPTRGLPGDTCELVKMYLSPSARGKGIAKMLLQNCIVTAQKQGFKRMYLETMPELNSAIYLYQKFGFNYLPGAIGNSGHNGCTIWMLKEI